MDPAIQKLLDESRALRHEDPHAMLALARQAVRAANRLPQNLARERCESWAHYANALRVCNQFREARGAFRQAWTAFERIGVVDPLLAARIHELEASLQESTGEFREADLSLEKALLIRLGQSEDRAAVGACLVQRANVAGHAGDLAAAIRYLRSALDYPARDSVTAFAVVHNLAWFLVDAGEPDLALTVILEHSAVAPAPSGPTLLRSRWLSARILAALSRDDCTVAQLELSAVRDEFLALGLPYDAALAGLESLSFQAVPDPSSLAALHQIFDALGVEREALATQLLLDAARNEHLDILVPRIVEALKDLAATGKLNLRMAEPVRVDRSAALL